MLNNQDIQGKQQEMSTNKDTVPCKVMNQILMDQREPKSA